MPIQLRSCRICGNTDLELVLDLGVQALTGVFPSDKTAPITAGPLELVKCAQGEGSDACGLLQLGHSYPFEEMYGEGYGYRSGLNATMVRHLEETVGKIRSLVELEEGDLIVDVGSNDGTLLGFYPEGPELVGVDPTAAFFSEFYRSDITVVPEFFSAETVRGAVRGEKAKVVTSIAMFYDLEEPMRFMQEVYDLLTDDGIWVFEQSYMPTMLDNLAYDTVCHEHLEYYGLKQIRWMVDRVGFSIQDIEFNTVNGGSFSVTVAKRPDICRGNTSLIERTLREEERRRLDTVEPYLAFAASAQEHRKLLVDLVRRIREQGGSIVGYGASTKGNVILQYCGFTAEEIPFIAEVNETKFGRFTPGTGIPIISEEEAKKTEPDFLMVLPWHFRDFFVAKEAEFISGGGRLLFPLPMIEIYPGDSGFPDWKAHDPRPDHV